MVLGADHGFYNQAEGAPICSAPSRRSAIRLPWTWKCRQRPGRGYQAAYLTKTEILQHSPYEATIFLDADTLVVGSIAELLESANSVTVTATNFCNWRTTDEIMRHRINAWRPLGGIVGDDFDLGKLIDWATNVPFAAINAGVFAVARDGPLLTSMECTGLASAKLQFS